MLRSIIAAIVIFFASIFGGHQAQPSPSAQSQPAAAAVAVSQSADPFQSAGISASNATGSPSSATSTVINQYITQPVIERVGGSDPLAAANFVTQDELNAQLLQLSNSLTARFSAPATSSIPEYVAADGNAEVPYAAENNISNLSGVTITNDEPPPHLKFPTFRAPISRSREGR